MQYVNGHQVVEELMNEVVRMADSPLALSPTTPSAAAGASSSTTSPQPFQFFWQPVAGVTEHSVCTCRIPTIVGAAATRCQMVLNLPYETLASQPFLTAPGSFFLSDTAVRDAKVVEQYDPNNSLIQLDYENAVLRSRGVIRLLHSTRVHASEPAETIVAWQTIFNQTPQPNEGNVFQYGFLGPAGLVLRRHPASPLTACCLTFVTQSFGLPEALLERQLQTGQPGTRLISIMTKQLVTMAGSACSPASAVVDQLEREGHSAINSVSMLSNGWMRLLSAGNVELFKKISTSGSYYAARGCKVLNESAPKAFHRLLSPHLDSSLWSLLIQSALNVEQIGNTAVILNTKFPNFFVADGSLPESVVLLETKIEPDNTHSIWLKTVTTPQQHQQHFITILPSGATITPMGQDKSMISWIFMTLIETTSNLTAAEMTKRAKFFVGVLMAMGMNAGGVQSEPRTKSDIPKIIWKELVQFSKTYKEMTVTQRTKLMADLHTHVEILLDEIAKPLTTEPITVLKELVASPSPPLMSPAAATTTLRTPVKYYTISDAVFFSQTQFIFLRQPSTETIPPSSSSPSTTTTPSPPAAHKIPAMPRAISKTPFDVLPDSVFSRIVSFLPLKSVGVLCRTSKAISQLLHSASCLAWSLLYDIHFAEHVYRVAHHVNSCQSTVQSLHRSLQGWRRGSVTKFTTQQSGASGTVTSAMLRSIAQPSKPSKTTDNQLFTIGGDHQVQCWAVTRSPPPSLSYQLVVANTFTAKHRPISLNISQSEDLLTLATSKGHIMFLDPTTMTENKPSIDTQFCSFVEGAYFNEATDAGLRVVMWADTTITWHDITTNKALNTFTGGHTKRVTGVKPFDPHRTTLVSASVDKTVRIWDSRSGKPATVIKGGHSAVIHSLDVFDDFMAATGAADNTVKCWDLRATQNGPLAILTGHTGPVRKLCHANRLLLSGSDDGTVHLWRRATWSSLSILDDESNNPITAVDLQGSLLVAANEQGVITCWSTD